jgi:hypothetical protein
MHTLGVATRATALVTESADDIVSLGRPRSHASPPPNSHTPLPPHRKTLLALIAHTDALSDDLSARVPVSFMARLASGPERDRRDNTVLFLESARIVVCRSY